MRGIPHGSRPLQAVYGHSGCYPKYREVPQYIRPFNVLDDGRRTNRMPMARDTENPSTMSRPSRRPCHLPDPSPSQRNTITLIPCRMVPQYMGPQEVRRGIRGVRGHGGVVYSSQKFSRRNYRSGNGYPGGIRELFRVDLQLFYDISVISSFFSSKGVDFCLKICYIYTIGLRKTTYVRLTFTRVFKNLKRISRTLRQTRVF